MVRHRVSALKIACFSLSLQIKWQPVMMGFFLQFTFAVLTLQTKVGYTVFEFIGAQTTALMDNSKVGASFVFGDLFQIDCFAIKVNGFLLIHLECLAVKSCIIAEHFFQLELPVRFVFIIYKNSAKTFHLPTLSVH